MIGSPILNAPAPSPWEDNYTEPFPKMFYEIGEHLGGILDHSSRSLMSFICVYRLASSIQTTGFQWGSSPETEMTIAKCWFCGQLILFLWILMCAWGYCPAGRSICGQLSASWQRQPGFGWNVLVLGKVHDCATDLNKVPRTSGSKIAS